jgi:hypothetical protein
MRHRGCLGPGLDLFNDPRCDRVSAFSVVKRGKMVMQIPVLPSNKNGEGFFKDEKSLRPFQRL